MNLVQTVSLVLVLAGGACVVLSRVPLRQTLLLSIYGIALALLFFSFQAPDVALSEIVVGSIGLPLIILAALRKMSEQARGRRREDE